MKRKMRQLWAVTMLFGIEWFRRWPIIVGLAIFPVAIYLVFSLFGGETAGKQVMFGMLIAGSITTGITSLAQCVVFTKSLRIQDMFVTSPVDSLTYAFGIALSRLLPGLFSTILFMGVMLAVGYLEPSKIVITLLLVEVSDILGAMLGFLVATYFSNPQHIGGIAAMLGFLMTMVPPVLYPLDVLPPLWQYIMGIFPPTHAAHLVRTVNGVTGDAALPMWVSATALLFFFVTSVYLVARRSRWREV
jgi:ABC-type polysaccharide/polyol phosphate export permease